jgi:DNA-binding HxlR family transcriptional regulator
MFAQCQMPDTSGGQVSGHRVRGAVTCVDLTFIEQIEELFRYRWEPYILLCLADGPKRYTTIASTINRQSTGRLSDGALSRSLDQLEAAGLARTVSETGEGRRCGPWTLTPAARPYVAKLLILQKALTEELPPTREPSDAQDPDHRTDD